MNFHSEILQVNCIHNSFITITIDLDLIKLWGGAGGPSLQIYDSILFLTFLIPYLSSYKTGFLSLQNDFK